MYYINKKIKVLIIQRIFSIYRKPIFELLNKIYELKLLHASNKSGIKQTDAHYAEKVWKVHYLNGETSIILGGLKNMWTYNPDIIIHELNPGILSMYVWFIYSKLSKKKIILWTQGIKIGSSPKNNQLKNRIKIWIMNHSDAILLYSESGRNYYSRFINTEKIFVANNALDSNYLIELREKFRKLDRTNIKKEIKWKSTYNLLYIGRLEKRKLPLILLDIFNSVQNKMSDYGISLHIVGSGPMLQEMQYYIRKKKIKNVIFHGAIYEDINKYKFIYISDLFVMPGSMGLAVNESIALGCPIMTLNPYYFNIVHGPEVESIINYKTGFLAKSVSECVDQIVAYLKDRNLQNKMRKYSFDFFSKELTINKMLDGFVNAINYVSKF